MLLNLVVQPLCTANRVKESRRETPEHLPSAEVGKVNLKSNGDEALNDEFLFKSNGDEALNDGFP